MNGSGPHSVRPLHRDSLVRDHRLDHRNNGQDKDNGKDNTADDVGGRRPTRKISGAVLGTLDTEGSGNYAADDIKEPGFFLGRHGLTAFLCAWRRKPCSQLQGLRPR